MTIMRILQPLGSVLGGYAFEEGFAIAPLQSEWVVKRLNAAPDDLLWICGFCLGTDVRWRRDVYAT